MIIGNDLPLVGPWLARGSSIGILFLLAAGAACRQMPNPLLLGSTNDVRVADRHNSVPWAESVQVQGLPNLYQVSDSLYRGAQPTAGGLAQLRTLGVKTVINLRESNGDAARLAESGVAYEHIPMSAFFVKDDDVVHFLRVAGRPDHGPVFVHCQRGADRTGLMCAVYRIVVQGWTKDEALAEMTQGGFGFNHGLQNIVNYIRDLDIEQIKQRAGLTAAPSLSLN